VAPEWASFRRFLSDMGERPPGLSLDRKDNSQGYNKNNCRWATAADQARNRRSSKLDARKVRQIRWLAELGYSYASIGRMYGVTGEMVSYVVRGVSWQDTVSSSGRPA
jgi:hypothetical protein